MLSEKPFQDAGELITEHPFLKEAAAGTLPMEKWARYFSGRLQAGPGFVTFLSNLQMQADAKGEDGIAAAVGKNLDEELGIVDGETVVERSHHEWREWFRMGIKRVFQERGTDIPNQPAADFTQVLGYPAAFSELNGRGDIFESTGALGVLEIGLGMEYVEIIKGLEAMGLRDTLTAREWTYLRSHAHHDARHFDEVFKPLAKACKNGDHKARIVRGIALAQRVKLAFLDGAYTMPSIA